VLFDMQPKKAVINDYNSELINVYKIVKDNPVKLLELLEKHKENNNEDYYYNVRALDRDSRYKMMTDEEKAARIIYLNKTCFNGLFRVNQAGQFNSPYGRYKTTMEKIASFITEEASQLLQRTLILNEDFEEVFNRIKDIENPFIFLDPPYISTFHHYNGSDGFTIEDHERLAKCFKEIHGKCLLIINDHPIVRELYADYIKDSYDKNYAINVKNRMKDVTEARHLIIANYDI